MTIVASGPFTTTPSVLSLAQLRAQVARYVKLPDDPDALAIATEKINNAVRRLNGRVWNWSLTYQDITLVTNTADYTLNNDVKRPRHLHILDASSNRWAPVGFKDPKTFDLESASQPSAGFPESYTLRNYDADGILSLDKVVDSSTVARYPTARLRYFRRLSYPAVDSTPLGCPAHVEPFVAWWAKAEMAADFMPSKIDTAVRYATQLWNDLIADDKLFDDWD